MKTGLIQMTAFTARIAQSGILAQTDATGVGARKTVSSHVLLPIVRSIMATALVTGAQGAPASLTSARDYATINAVQDVFPSLLSFLLVEPLRRLFCYPKTVIAGF